MADKYKVAGDTTITQGTQDPKQWKILQADGSTAVDLTDATSVEMRLREEDTEDVTVFSTAGGSPLLAVTDAEGGIVQLNPESDTSEDATEYQFYFVINDSTGPHPVPEDVRYRLIVREAFTT